MVAEAHRSGYPSVRPAHNVVFATLAPDHGERTVDLAHRAGITRQSMGEVVRDLVDLGVIELVPDPQDGRAKLVRYTPEGLVQTRTGYRHLVDLEERFEAEFGEDYEAARRVLDGVVAILMELPGR